MGEGTIEYGRKGGEVWVEEGAGCVRVGLQMRGEYVPIPRVLLAFDWVSVVVPAWAVLVLIVHGVMGKKAPSRLVVEVVAEKIEAARRAVSFGGRWW